MIRLALFAASPVYYQAPLYRRLADDPAIDFTAIFASDEGAARPFDDGYASPVRWGVDPTVGFRSVFLAKAGTNPNGGTTFALRDHDVVGHIWRGRYDALWLHGYHTVTHVLAALAQRARGGAILYREEQTMLTPRATWRTAVKHVGLRALFRGSHGLYLGTHNRMWFERWGIPAERLFHVPYAVDNDRLRADAQDLRAYRSELRAEIGVDSDAPVVLMLGRLVSKKQPLAVLEAFAAVRREQPCSLLIVGTGPLDEALRRKVEADAIPDVVFAGFLDQTEVARAYAAADLITLFSSENETWGLVVNEAMNFGLPVVASDRVGCAVDLVEHGESGFVVRHDDVRGLAEALSRLVKSAELRARFGRRALEIIDGWTYDVAAAGVVEAVTAAVCARRIMLDGAPFIESGKRP